MPNLHVACVHTYTHTYILTYPLTYLSVHIYSQLQELFKEIANIDAHLPRGVVTDICRKTNIDSATRFDDIAAAAAVTGVLLFF